MESMPCARTAVIHFETVLPYRSLFIYKQWPTLVPGAFWICYYCSLITLLNRNSEVRVTIYTFQTRYFTRLTTMGLIMSLAGLRLRSRRSDRQETPARIIDPDGLATVKVRVSHGAKVSAAARIPLERRNTIFPQGRPVETS